ncbi:MAG: DUF6044 family protein [Sediminibacterium sp.]|nr:DUF6044 family protein [Sediminibacterium sp.]
MFKKNAYFILLGVFSILILYFPIFISGENSYILIPDVLNCEFVWLHVLKITHNLFEFNGNVPIENFMNGLPRKYIQSEFDFKRVFFYILPSFWAYIGSSIIVRIIGFIGMYLIIRDHITIQNKKIVFLICLCFSLVPCYTIYGLSVLGQPILLWAFINLIKNERKLLSFLLILFFPFYSHIALIGPFILGGLTLFGFYNIFFQDKKLNKYYWIGILILLCSFILANINLILTYFGGELSNRSIRIVSGRLPTFRGYIYSIFRTVVFGNAHPANLIALPIIGLFLYAVIVNKLRSRLITVLWVIIILSSILFANMGIFNYYLSDYFKLLKSFDFGRVIFLNPMIFFIILILIITQNRIKSKIVYLTLIIQLSLNILSCPEISYNIFGNIISQNILDDIVDINRPAFRLYHSIDPDFKKDYVERMDTTQDQIISYKSFFSENLFKKIDNYINIPKQNYRVVSVGLAPSISQFNGFYTLDGDFDIYPATYYRLFGKIIEDEIKKNEFIKWSYDYGGFQTFIYSSELVDKYFNSSMKFENTQINNLSINIEQLKSMGGKYIFSAVPINNYSKLKLNFEKMFTDSTSAFNIYLYSL